jgi:hypothetical protein
VSFDRHAGDRPFFQPITIFDESVIREKWAIKGDWGNGDLFAVCGHKSRFLYAASEGRAWR